MKKSRYEIEQIFSQLQSENFVMLKLNDLKNIIQINREIWNIPKSVSERKIVNQLLEKGFVEKLELDFPFRKETRYVLKQIPLLEKLQIVYPKAYYSHHTAAFLNNLLKTPLSQLFLNNEQRIIPRSDGELNQQGIDMAFRNKPRITSNTIKLDKYFVYLLNGKNTNCAGVTNYFSEKTGNVRITSIERTLIDMVVRPFYSGGPIDVQIAFINARPFISVDKLKSILVQLDYIYPYHQSIGFYLDSAGVYTEDELDIFKLMEKQFDFYLSNAMTKTEYSATWKVHYPQELKRLVNT